MSDDMRFRFRERPRQTNIPKREPKQTTNSSSIFGIWDEQRQMQAEEDKMAKELAETKKKAKELQRTLRKNRYGELNKHTTHFSTKFITDLKSYRSKYSGFLFNFAKNHKKTFYVVTGVFVVLVSVVLFSDLFKSDNKTETLGNSTSVIPVADDLPREKPDFSILYPKAKTAEDFDVVRISPPEADASYTFLDRFTDDGAIFRVTQQEIPDNFDLDKTATEFQATSIIQIDGNPVYNGYSEMGGVQSLIFVKEGILVSIRSPQKFSDDQWVAYISSLR
jgi:hypothetical protein